jgi:hypothetical protein
MLAMLLKDFCWNGLYSTDEKERDFAKKRLQAHYDRFALARRGVKKAIVRYESS